MTQEAVPVEQRHRDAAAEVYNMLGFGPCQHIIDGIEDDIGVVQAFARFEATLRPAIEAWQPIETAPLGATDVLLAFPNGRIAVGWRHSADYFLTSGAEPFGQEPTHWRPLPAPPRTTKGQVDA